MSFISAAPGGKVSLPTFFVVCSFVAAVFDGADMRLHALPTGGSQTAARRPPRHRRDCICVLKGGGVECAAALPGSGALNLRSMESRRPCRGTSLDACLNLDAEPGTLHGFRNGQSLGVAFQQSAAPCNPAWHTFPAFSFFTHWALPGVNFGAKPFAHPVEGSPASAGTPQAQQTEQQLGATAGV